MSYDLRKTLSSTALLAHLQERGVPSTKRDRNTELNVAAAKKAHPATVRVTKRLLTHPEWKELIKRKGQVRNLHLSLTAPWQGSTGRLIAARAVTQWEKQMAKAIAHWEEQKLTVLRAWDDILKEARVMLGEWYDDADFPTPETLRQRLQLMTRIEPIPDGRDVRASVSEDILGQIVQSNLEAQQEAADEAIRLAYERLHEVVQHVATKLDEVDNKKKGPNGRAKAFRNTLIDNVVSVCDAVAIMNVTGDPTLDKLAAEIRSTLGEYRPDKLRAEKGTRRKAQSEAARLAAKVKGLAVNV